MQAMRRRRLIKMICRFRRPDFDDADYVAVPLIDTPFFLLCSAEFFLLPQNP